MSKAITLEQLNVKVERLAKQVERLHGVLSIRNPKLQSNLLWLEATKPTIRRKKR